MRIKGLPTTMSDVQREPLIYREEVTAILGVLADINVHVRKILDLLLEELGGEEEGLGDDG